MSPQSRPLKEGKSLSQLEVALPLAWNELLVDEAHIVSFTELMMISLSLHSCLTSERLFELGRGLHGSGVEGYIFIVLGCRVEVLSAGYCTLIQFIYCLSRVSSGSQPFF